MRFIQNDPGVLESDLPLGQPGESLRSLGAEPGGFTDQLQSRHMRNVQHSGRLRSGKALGQGRFLPPGRFSNVPGEEDLQPGGNTGLLGLGPADQHSQTLQGGHGVLIPQ